jgi:hypothetical protein
MGVDSTAYIEGGGNSLPSPREVIVKPASLFAIIVFALVAAAHLLRLVCHTEVLIGGAIIPMWASVLGLIVPGALAVALWRESSVDRF